MDKARIAALMKLGKLLQDNGTLDAMNAPSPLDNVSSDMYQDATFRPQPISMDSAVDDSGEEEDVPARFSGIRRLIAPKK